MNMALEDMIKGYDVAIVGSMEEIHGDKFEIIKQKAVEIKNQTGLKVIVACFYANNHQAVEIPIYHNERLIGYETWQDGEVIAMRGVNDKN